jgi:cation:H+ antiporter
MIYLEIGAGFVLLLIGGDLLVRGAVTVAWRLGVSPLLIGLTLVGFGTSTPELLTSVQAALLGSPGIAVGNVVGSNICNILLILGIAAVIYPIRTSPDAVWRDGTVAMVAAIACTGAALIGTVNAVSGMVLIGLLVAYIVYTYFQERLRFCVVPHSSDADVANPDGTVAGIVSGGLALAGLIAASGLGFTLLGAHFLVGGSIDLARALGTSETVIGLTVVAIGTSLPELVTSVVASLRRHADVAFGNVVGSNIFNVFGILGVTAIVEPIVVPPEIARVDVWVMLAASLALIVFSLTGARLSRAEGGLFIAAYGAYMASLVLVGD